MAISNKNGELVRRFKLYGFGFLMGLFVVSFVYKGESCQMPGSIKMDELAQQKLSITEHANCILTCNGLEQKDIVGALKTGKVDFGESDVRREPFPLYAVEGTTANGTIVHLTIEDIGETSSLKHLEIEGSVKECACK